MAVAAREGAGTDMDISDQKRTFSGFLTAALWCSALIMMAVALLTVAFAMHLGWFAGLGAFTVIGVGVGLGFRMPGAWWAMLVALVIMLGVGGAIVPAVYNLLA